MISNLVESIYNFILVRGEEYNSLPKYLEAFDYKTEVLAGTRFNLANDQLRDLYMNKLVNHRQTDSITYKVLLR